MSDFPSRIAITEEGPREGFQIESADISTADKVRFIDALSQTGVDAIQVCSFVSPRLVPGWADADRVAQDFQANPDVCYTALWFNQRGIERAIAHRDRFTLTGTIHLAASEAFSRSNLNRDRATNIAAMRKQTSAHQAADIQVSKISVMAAFGCNFAGDITDAQVVDAVTDGFSIADEASATIKEIALADTMGWAHPEKIKQVVGRVRELWPDVAIRLHLHDTRGLGVANAYAALTLGVDRFDSTCAGLGGCPFAAHKGAPGNVATEELVMLAQELGIETGIDIDALIEAGHLAESIVGHSLPSAALKGGSLTRFRASAQGT